MNIMILNLPRETTKQELTELFAKFGKVSSCDIILDKVTGKSKGFGFVEMQNEAEAKLAIAGLHGTKIAKNTIRVKQAEERR